MTEPTIVPENKRLLVAVCYIIPLLGGIVLFLIAEGNRSLKFHGFQAIVLGLIVWLLGFVSVCFMGILGFVLWLYCLYGAYVIYTKGDWRSFVASFVDSSLMK